MITEQPKKKVELHPSPNSRETKNFFLFGYKYKKMILPFNSNSIADDGGKKMLARATKRKFMIRERKSKVFFSPLLSSAVKSFAFDCLKFTGAG